MEHNACGSPWYELPQPWLLRLFDGQHLDANSKLSLFQTSQHFNEITMQYSKHTCLRVNFTSGAQDLAPQIKAISNASKHASRIHLSMIGHLKGIEQLLSGELLSDDVKKPLIGRLKGIFKNMRGFLQAAAEAKVTDAVKELHIKLAWLDAVLPSVFWETCPNLTRLTLHGCHIQAFSFSRAPQHLEELELRGITILEETKAGSAYEQHIRAQLDTLIGLQSLTLSSKFQFGRKQRLWGTHNLPETEMMKVLARQLTHLCWDTGASFPYRPNYLQQLQAPGTVLQHLILPNGTATNGDLKVFLQLPSLRRLEVHRFKLKASFAGWPCKWEQLRCEEIGIKELAHLPMHGDLICKIEPLKDPPGLTIPTAILWINGASSGLVRQAVCNVGKCKALQWSARRVTVRSGPDVAMYPTAFATCLIRALPLLSTAKDLHIRDGCFNTAAMQAISAFVSVHKPGLSFHIGDYCTWDIEGAVSLIANMPSGSLLGLTIQADADAEDKITQLCCAAQRPLNLLVRCHARLMDGYYDRIQSAMQACGHQHVNLRVY